MIVPGELSIIDACCPCCGDEAGSVVARTKDFEFETSALEFSYVRCSRCRLVYLRNRPASSELSRIYPPEYFEYESFLGKRAQRLRLLSQRAKVRALGAHLRANSFIVDAGCGTGDLLHALKVFGRPGWRLLGIDPSEPACAAVRAKGIDARSARLEDVRWHTDAPDAIVMNQVLEHLEAPQNCVRMAFDILTPGGVLVVETPSTNSWDAALFGHRYWAGWHCPRHWQVYDPDTLTTSLRKAGFDVIDVSFLLSPFNWLRSIQNQLRDHGWYHAARFSSERVVPALVAACCVDVAQRAITGRTSNIRVVGRKPALEDQSGVRVG